MNNERVFYSQISAKSIESLDLSNISHASVDYLEIAKQVRKIAESCTEPSLKESYQLIADCAEMGYDNKNDEVPFVSSIQMCNTSSINLEDLTENLLNCLLKAASVTKNAFLQAKLLDIVWAKDTKRHQLGVAALNSYIDLLNQVIENAPQDVFEFKVYLEKAIKISYKLGKIHEYKPKFKTIFDKIIMPEENEKRGATRYRFLELSIKYKINEPSEELSTLIRKWATEAQKNNDLEKTKRYFEILGLMSRISKNKTEELALKKERAMLFVEDARSMAKDKASPLILENLYTKAIYELRLVGGMRPLIDELHNELVEIQKETPDHMKGFEQRFDVKPLVDEAREKLNDKNTLEALFVLASRYGRPPSKKAYYESAKEQVQQYPLQFLFGRTTINAKGRVVARSDGGGDLFDDKNIEQAVIQHFNTNITVSGSVADFLRRELLSKHDFGFDDFDILVSSNPVIPKGREKYFKKALWYGFRGDWIECLHIMIPQLENSIREYLEGAGYLTELIDDDLTQEQKSLTTILEKPFTEKVFGEDMVMFWRLMYADQRGLNLRNLIAHGLYEGSDFSDDVGAMCWLNFIHYLALGARSRVARLEAIKREETESKAPVGGASE